MAHILDISRGLAALCVFFFHIHDTLMVSMPSIANVFRYGSFGVPLFFVISGYVICASATSTIKKEEPAISFLKRRLLRIYPPFWLSIAVVASVPYIISGISALKSGLYEPPILKFLDFEAIDWIEILTLVRVFRAEDADLQAQFNAINSVYWTLAIEFQFYLVVFIALLFRRLFPWIIAAVSAISISVLFYPESLNRGLFLHYWPMFALGIGLLYLFRLGVFPTSPRLSSLFLILIMGFMLICAYACNLSDKLGSVFGSPNLGFAVISTLSLWLAKPLGPAVEKASDSGGVIIRALIKTAVYLGVISYSVYLLHGKLFNVPAMFVRQIFPLDNPFNPILSVIGTLLLCSVFYIYCEKPCQSTTRKRINESALAAKSHEY